MNSPAPPGALTSQNNPIRVAWIERANVPAAAGWTGRVGMTFLPGKHDVGLAGRHWRDLELDVTALREIHQVDTFVLLVEDHELQSTSTTGIGLVMEQHGIDLVRFPIRDGGVPSDPVAYVPLVQETLRRLQAGQNVVVACRGGLGRTGTLVACLLREAGLEAQAAIDLTRATRKCTIEDSSQEDFVRAWL